MSGLLDQPDFLQVGDKQGMVLIFLSFNRILHVLLDLNEVKLLLVIQDR
jgi:hypothetical protein